MGHEDGQEAQGSQLPRKNRRDTNPFPQNQPLKGTIHHQLGLGSPWPAAMHVPLLGLFGC